jgi:hypothetical protein
VAITDETYVLVSAAVRRKHSVVTKFLGLSDLFRRVLRKAEPSECAIRVRFD